ncbi:hypothetical protein BV898_02780 [Hypsibius exemplaris]|uniref:G-protein coupled receptors family 1 profile domain-containing protein n=1 Tax=Hypsibius exemplaris TaxID=2072580 RepID=A0A1W0X7P3_HYPEX|nr:hypothetical protein BV898_02780 [Hypsibius exemplaris]
MAVLIVNGSVLTMLVTINAVVVACQLFNLIVFHFWRDKQPFVLFHVALAWPSLLASFITPGTPLVRMFPWREPASVVLISLCGGSYELWTTLSQIVLVAISVDRWLSVEYPITYRHRITRRTVRWIILLTWAVSAL